MHHKSSDQIYSNSAQHKHTHHIFPALSLLQNNGPSFVINQPNIKNQPKILKIQKLNGKTPIPKLSSSLSQKPKQSSLQSHDIIKQKIKKNIVRLLKSQELQQIKNSNHIKLSTSYNNNNFDQYSNRGYMSFVQQQISKLEQIQKQGGIIKKTRKHYSRVLNLNNSTKQSKNIKQTSFKSQKKSKAMQPYKIVSILLTERPPPAHPSYNNSVKNIKQKQVSIKKISYLQHRLTFQNPKKDIILNNDTKQHINIQIKPWQLDLNAQF